MVSVVISSYIIFVVTSLADTPILYLARHMKEHGKDGILIAEETAKV